MLNLASSYIQRRGLYLAPALFFFLALNSALGLAENAPSSELKPFKKFIVYQDKNTPNRFVPSGYMPTGECIMMDDAWKENCKEGKTCLKVTYDIACSHEGRNWAGVYWLNPADNWGDRKGGYNLTGAKKLVFWAKGEKGGEVVAEFKMGGIGVSREFPDTDTAAIGPVILKNEWRQYSIDLTNKDLTYISGGFAWVANTENNPASCTFFIDDVHYE